MHIPHRTLSPLCLALVLLLAVTACSRAAVSTATPVPTPIPAQATPTAATAATRTPTLFGTASATAPATTPTTTPIPVPTADLTLLKRLTTIEERTSQIRGLSTSAAKEKRVVSREQLKAVLKHEEGTDAAKLKTTQSLLRFLGLLSPNDDLETLENDLLNQQVLGLFDPLSGELYVVSDSGSFSTLDEFTYSHEYTHSLQQGTFDIAKAEKGLSNNSEASSAYTALVEGDAVVTSILYAQKYLDVRELARQEQSSGGTPTMAYPKFLTDSLVFPYTTGVAFVQYLFQRGGFDAIDKAFRSPPVSTSQIIHPEKYTAGNAPENVTLPDLQAKLGTGWTKLDEDEFGEFDLRLYLELHTTTATAAKAADGWHGDRFAFLRGPNDQLLVVALFQWETAKEAREFFSAYTAGMTQQAPSVRVAATKASGLVAGQYQYLSIQGKGTLLVLASQASAAEPVVSMFTGY